MEAASSRLVKLFSEAYIECSNEVIDGKEVWAPVERPNPIEAQIEAWAKTNVLEIVSVTPTFEFGKKLREGWLGGKQTITGIGENARRIVHLRCVAVFRPTQQTSR